MSASLILAAVLTVLVVAWLVRRREHFRYFEKRGIRGPPPNVFFGNSLELSSKNMGQCHVEWAEKYGDVFGYFNGMLPVLVVGDKELVKEIEIKRFSAFMDRGSLFGKPPYSEALPTLNGQRWKYARTVLTPAFSASKLKSIFSGMSEIVDEMLALIEKAAVAGGDSLKGLAAADAQTESCMDVNQLFRAVSVELITRLGMGINYGVMKDIYHPVVQRVSTALGASYNMALVVLASFPVLSSLAPHLFRLGETLRNRGNVDGWSNPSSILMRDCSAAIKARRDPSQAASRRSDLLQLLIDARYKEFDTARLEIGNEADFDRYSNDPAANAKAAVNGETTPLEASGKVESESSGLTHKAMIQTAWILMIAGYETTANTLITLAHVLMTRPDVQDRMRAELREHSMRADSQPDYEKLLALPYMEAVIKEVLRRYPLVSFVTRQALSDIELSNGLRILKDEHVVIPIDLIHQNEKYYPEPSRFLPERFLTPGEVDPVTFQAFGGGPRNCIGMRLALVEIKLILTKVLLRYRLEAPEDNPKELTFKEYLSLYRHMDRIRVRFVKI